MGFHIIELHKLGSVTDICIILLSTFSRLKIETNNNWPEWSYEVSLQQNSIAVGSTFQKHAY